MTPESLNLDDITQACLDSAAYVLFAAVLTNERDPKTGALMVKSFYRRYQLSLEDVRAAVKAFHAEHQKEVQQFLVGPPPGDET